jgi:ornithine carbamoyltransferase
MNLPLNHRVLQMRPLPPADAELLLGTARALKRAAQAGIAQPLLQGKNIVVHSEGAEDAAASPVATAAAALGARVSRLRLLARLYDAVDCECLPAADAARLQVELGVPVYSGLVRGGHPLHLLGDSLGGGKAPADDADYLVQALLVNTVVG